MNRLLGVRPEEVAPVLWSAGYFFFVLLSLYLMRPMREAAGIEGGAEDLPWLFTCTMIGMFAINPAFAALVARFPRRRFIPITYRFFIVNIVVFAALFALLKNDAFKILGWVFYVWLSVFNMFAVSVFWQLMVDLWRNHQSKRVFGVIGVGGTLGAIMGSSGVGTLAEHLETPMLFLLVAGISLEVACRCALQLMRIGGITATAEDPEIGGDEDSVMHASREEPEGGVLTGIWLLLRSPYLLGISLFILGLTAISTVLYMLQGEIIYAAFEESKVRRAVFARIDTATNTITLLVQLFFTGRIIRLIGLGWTLAVLPLLCIGGFLVLGIMLQRAAAGEIPAAATGVVAAFVVFQVLRRGLNYALTRPSREILYTVVSQEEKYKSKAFIDTFIYRGGDAATAQVYNVFVNVLHVGLASITLWTIPVVGLWLMIGLFLGRAQQQKLQEQETEAESETTSTPVSE